MFPSTLLLSFCAAALVAQDGQPQKFGTPYRGDVDAAVRALRSDGDERGKLDVGGFGDGSCIQTAKVLTAMGHCHRFYSLADGPVTRQPVKHLFLQRNRDGSFGPAGDEPAARIEATLWVVEALDAMEPEELKTDIAQARAWLERHAPDAQSPWRAQVARVLDAYATGSSDPKRMGAPLAEQLGAALETGDSAAAIDALVGIVACQAAARMIDAGEGLDGPIAEWTPVQQKGFEFLLTQQEDGVFFVNTEGGKFPDTGLSALGLAALQTKPAAKRTKEEQATIDAGLTKLLAEQNEDGSFAERNANYTTCAAILALVKAEREEFAPAIARAQKYILGIQNIEDNGYARSDRDYGSIGYGGDQRGDLSNMQFAIQALHESGLQEDHEAFAKALVFLQRTQNLKSVNDFSGRVREDGEWIEVTSGDDGGAAYYPGNSAAGYIELPDGKKIPRSYGSMTYALLKTYTLAGVDASDPRVQAAVDWIERNWTLEINPGADPELPEKAKYQGLYYYYMVLAQALDEAGMDVLEVPTGDGDEVTEVRWREKVQEHLASIQSDDGSWVNERNGRWWEDQRAICTIYCLLALDRAQQ